MSVTKRCTFFVSLCFLAGAGNCLPPPAEGQTQPAKLDAAKTKRVAYIVKHGSAKDLAALLGKHFKADVEIEAFPDAASNVLLLSASPAVFDELLATLAKLDRRPQTVVVEVLVIDVPAKRSENGKWEPGDKDIDDKELVGPVDRVVAGISALQKKAVVSGFKRLQLTTLENMPTKLLSGETKAFITSVHTLASGQVSYTKTFKNNGTNVVVTPRVGADNAVTLELTVEESRPVVSEDGVPLGVNEKGQPIMSTDFVLAKLDAKVTVTSGQTALVSGVQTKSKSGNARTIILVTARVVQ